METINIQEIIKSKNINQTYKFFCLISRPQKKIARNNKAFLNFYLIDKTGQINAKKWDIDELDEQHLVHGNVVEVEGKLSDFQGNKQIIVSGWKVVNDEKIKEGLFPEAPYSNEQMWEEFKEFIKAISDKDYFKLVNSIFSGELKQSFKKHQAGLSVHHDVQGGLLWHSLTMLKMAKKLIQIYDYVNFNQSLLYAGIMLHDIGKIHEIEGDLPKQYSIKGKMLGHISIGSMLTKEFGEKLNLPEDKIHLLQHMILSSHGKLENGSPVRPILMESFILSQLDDLDSKTNAIWKNLKQASPNEFTQNIFALDNANFFNLSPKEEEKD